MWKPLKDLPDGAGEYLVWLEKPLHNSRIQVLSVGRSGVPVVAGLFAFVAPTIISWRPMVEGPESGEV